MGMGDKLRNAAGRLRGRAKEAAGTATGDKARRRQGRLERMRADLRQAGEKVKDAFRR
jgi:uncharacterized protein YjbJ (UPF0337 family)